MEILSQHETQEKLKFKVLQTIILDKKASSGYKPSRTTTPAQSGRDSKEWLGTKKI